jgi:hypothetical protein
MNEDFIHSFPQGATDSATVLLIVTSSSETCRTGPSRSDLSEHTLTISSLCRGCFSLRSSLHSVRPA